MTKEELLNGTKAVLLDLDGTVYLDETPIGDAAETLNKLRSAGKKLVFLTNNSSRTEAEYRAKLTRIGLWDDRDRVYTSGMAAIDYLLHSRKGASVYLLGTEALKEEFSRAGIALNDENPDICVLAYDIGLTFEKIRRFDAFLRRGTPYIATHPDDVCPTQDGSMPDVGSFIAMFEKSSGRLPDRIIGKPFTDMGDSLCGLLGVAKAEMCMIGDRMHTDIRFGNANGMKTVLVLSGETTEESMRDFPDRPDLVLPSINDLVKKSV